MKNNHNNETLNKLNELKQALKIISKIVVNLKVDAKNGEYDAEYVHFLNENMICALRIVQDI